MDFWKFLDADGETGRFLGEVTGRNLEFFADMRSFSRQIKIVSIFNLFNSHGIGRRE
jgi:hypothetical protein